MQGMLRIECTFRFVSGFHVSGDRLELWVDKALLCDPEEGRFPMIPATTLKGWFREGAERALRSLGIPACDASSPETICGTCLVCLVFGHPRKKSLLTFENITLKGASKDTRMSVSLSRSRKTAYEERLFSLEVGSCPSFSATIWGLFPDIQEAKRAALLLFLGTRTSFAIGGGKSRGLGWLHCEEFTATFDGQKIPQEDLLEELEVLRVQRGVTP